ncbi:hypothetical protein ACWCYZ_28975 [Streptomyces virginiae]
MATDERFTSEVNCWYRVGRIGTAADVSRPERDDMATYSYGGSRPDLYRREGQEREQPTGGTGLAGFLDELVKLRSDFERRLVRIEQALMPQMLDQPAHV